MTLMRADCVKAVHGKDGKKKRRDNIMNGLKIGTYVSTDKDAIIFFDDVDDQDYDDSDGEEDDGPIGFWRSCGLDYAGGSN